MQFKCKSGTYFGPVQQCRPYENMSVSLKKTHQIWQLLKAAKHLPGDFLESINFEIFSVRKMGSSISIKAKEDFLNK